MNFLSFYLGTEADDKGRKITDILAWSDFRLEHTHNYIQRVFPNLVPSASDYSAPVITEQEAAELREAFADKDTRAKMYFDQMYRRMLRFWKLDAWEQTHDSPAMMILPKKPHWVNPDNHNYLRLTRVLKCFELFGLDKEALELNSLLKRLYSLYPQQIGDATMNYWNETDQNYLLKRIGLFEQSIREKIDADNQVFYDAVPDIGRFKNVFRMSYLEYAEYLSKKHSVREDGLLTHDICASFYDELVYSAIQNPEHGKTVQCDWLEHLLLYIKILQEQLIADYPHNKQYIMRYIRDKIDELCLCECDTLCSIAHRKFVLYECRMNLLDEANLYNRVKNQYGDSLHDSLLTLIAYYCYVMRGESKKLYWEIAYAPSDILLGSSQQTDVIAYSKRMRKELTEILSNPVLDCFENVPTLSD